MKERIVNQILEKVDSFLEPYQLKRLKKELSFVLGRYLISEEMQKPHDDQELIRSFISAKRVEGLSSKTLAYYEKTIKKMYASIQKNTKSIETDNLRDYFSNYQSTNGISKVTVDNVRRILSTYFSWLEDEDYILKSPIRRIHKIKAKITVKEVYADESLELMRDICDNPRDLAIVDMLASTGMRVGELVLLNKFDVDFREKECKVFGKGGRERIVYFDARTKLHLEEYLESREDNNEALFVTLSKGSKRLSIGSVESRIRAIGKKAGIEKSHPHKFRRTLATKAIDKGMPIEQLQVLLGHKRIDTTLQYAMVNQTNVKTSHRRYIG